MIYISYLNVIYRLFPTSTTALILLIFLSKKISRFKSLLNVKIICISASIVLSCYCFHPSTSPLTYWFRPASAARRGGHVDTSTSLPLAQRLQAPRSPGEGQGQRRLQASRSRQPLGGRGAGELASDASPAHVREASPAQGEGLLGTCRDWAPGVHCWPGHGFWEFSCPGGAPRRGLRDRARARSRPRGQALPRRAHTCSLSRPALSRRAPRHGAHKDEQPSGPALRQLQLLHPSHTRDVPTKHKAPDPLLWGPPRTSTRGGKQATLQQKEGSGVRWRVGRGQTALAPWL